MYDDITISTPKSTDFQVILDIEKFIRCGCEGMIFSYKGKHFDFLSDEMIEILTKIRDERVNRCH